jgi:hypothetical protein
MQAMADGFSDDSLDTKPVEEWPAVPSAPVIPAVSPGAGTSTIFWQKGQMMGRNLAVAFIRELEDHPRQFTFISRDDQGNKTKRTIGLTGKMYLRALYKGAKGEVGAAIFSKLDRKLMEDKGQHWPLHRA